MRCLILLCCTKIDTECSLLLNNGTSTCTSISVIRFSPVSVDAGRRNLFLHVSSNFIFSDSSNVHYLACATILFKPRCGTSCGVQGRAAERHSFVIHSPYVAYDLDLLWCCKCCHADLQAVFVVQFLIIVNYRDINKRISKIYDIYLITSSFDHFLSQINNFPIFLYNLNLSVLLKLN